MRKVLFIVNPISGISGKKRVVSAIDKYIDRSTIEYSIEWTQYAGHAKILSGEAASKGFDTVVAVGGDGTVNEVASALVGSGTTFGIIPCGSGNGLARHLKIPMNAAKAVEVINRGRRMCMDTATVNGIPFFCTTGMGYDAQVAAMFAKSGTRGFFSYVKEVLAEWRRYTPCEYVITAGDKTLKAKALLITCGNADQWGFDFHITPQASVEDGLLELTIIKPISFFKASVLAVRAMGYSIQKDKDVVSLKSRDITIRCSGGTAAHYDGEVLKTDGTLSIHSFPHSLNVIY